MIGHSNGGQGTWYNAARHPDRVVASRITLANFLLAWFEVHLVVIAAAGYIKAQLYVPLTHSR
jgi:pimeloyl-ACP methyl ester carboxylesterase